MARISTYHHGDRLIKPSDSIAVKYGHSVKVSEERTQEFAYQNVDPCIVHVPRVYRFFSKNEPKEPMLRKVLI